MKNKLNKINKGLKQKVFSYYDVVLFAFFSVFTIRILDAIKDTDWSLLFL